MKAFWIFPALLVALAAAANPVDLQLVNGLTGRAEYRPGMADKPAVVILHGFLQTNQFPTVRWLVDALSGDGYTVLAPNLTLGVTNRRQGLACEAIHTHTMAGDTEEIDAWVNWLMHKRPNGIVLIGHSYGSVNALAYLSARPNAPIIKYIGISIIEARTGMDESQRMALIRELQNQIRKGDRGIVERPLSYCRKYLASPASLASYLEWSPDRVIQAAQRLPVPGLFIMGGDDERLGKGWLERLAKTRIQVKVIAGANHFMDGEHEFDLHDMVTHALNEIK